jgi:DNA-binding transcriptional ArsR family regulator
MPAFGKTTDARYLRCGSGLALNERRVELPLIQTSTLACVPVRTTSGTARPAMGCPGPRDRETCGPGAAEALAAMTTSPAVRAAATMLRLRVPMVFQTRRWDDLLQRFFAMAQRDPTRVQMWAMAHPIRLEILGVLVEGPATASMLARRLGESSGSTSYHLRVLARAGAVVEDPDLGTHRERWWRRPDPFVLIPTDDDLEGRAIGARMLGLFFARDERARRQLVTRDIGTAWRAGAFVGNWFLELTPDEADALAERLTTIVQELRTRPEPTPGADRALVSLSVLPWLE